MTLLRPGFARLEEQAAQADFPRFGFEIGPMARHLRADFEQTGGSTVEMEQIEASLRDFIDLMNLALKQDAHA